MVKKSTTKKKPTTKKNIELTDIETVGERARRCLGGIPYDGELLSWIEFNRIAERLWAIEGKLEFIGVDIAKDGTMFCVFQVIYKKSKRGRYYCVDNDIIFDFQKKQAEYKQSRR